MWFLSRTLRGAGVLFLGAGSAAFGVTLDWDTVAWANGSFSNSYDIDLLTNIRGLALDGTPLVAPTITTSGNNVLSGSAINQVVTGTTSTVNTGAGSGNGNVTVSFAGPIRSFTWTYGSGSAFANPTYQYIGMHDLTFTTVPEINPAWATAFSCIVAARLVLGHRARCRK